MAQSGYIARFVATLAQGLCVISEASRADLSAEAANRHWHPTMPRIARGASKCMRRYGRGRLWTFTLILLTWHLLSVPPHSGSSPGEGHFLPLSQNRPLRPQVRPG